jgi:hypothetical protein
MRLTRLFFIVLASFTLNIVNAQNIGNNQLKQDSIRETIIYEYDTVYVAPDTLIVTDTIVKYKSDTKPGRPSIILSFFDKLNLFKNFQREWSAGVGIYSFLSGFPGKDASIDSFSLARLINYQFEFHVNYTVGQNRYSLGVRFTPLREQLHYNETQYIKKDISQGVTDSLMVTNNGNNTNYYQLLGIVFNFSRNFGSRSVFFVFNGYVSADMVLGYSAYLPVRQKIEISSSSVRKIAYSFGVSPCLGFKFWQRIDLSIGPFCNYVMQNRDKYPVTSPFTYGMGIKIQ